MARRKTVLPPPLPMGPAELIGGIVGPPIGGAKKAKKKAAKKAVKKGKRGR